MNANVPEKIYIPEKIYLPYKDGKVIGLVKETGVPYKSGVDGNIEYTRTDTFIEEACEYISEHIEYYMKKEKMCNVPLCPLFATKSFIEDFKNYMKGKVRYE